MFCQKCGSKLPNDAEFCVECGLKLPTGYSGESDEPESSKDEADKHTFDNAKTIEKAPKKNESEFEQWWSNRSKAVKTLLIIASIIVGGFILFALVKFLNKFGFILFGLIVVIGAIVSLFTGTEEEKRAARRKLVKIFALCVIIVVAANLIVFNWGDVNNMIRPGYYVRDGCLQYNDNITVENAFTSFFDKPHWSFYKERDYSYVVFTGVCMSDGERSDAHITFIITGERFSIASLEINGEEILPIYWDEFFETVYNAS